MVTKFILPTRSENGPPRWSAAAPETSLFKDNFKNFPQAAYPFFFKESSIKNIHLPRFLIFLNMNPG
jgi:hypothetical protein